MIEPFRDRLHNMIAKMNIFLKHNKFHTFFVIIIDN